MRFMLAKILTEELAKGTTGTGHQEPTSSNWAETWDIFFAKGAMCSTLQEPASTNEQKYETLFSCLINIFCNISAKWSKWHSWAHLWWWSPLWLPLHTEDKTHVKKFSQEGTTHVQKIHIRRHNPSQEIQTRQCNQRTGDWYPYNSVFTWSRKTCLYFVPETIMQHTYLQKSKSILNLFGKPNTVKTTTTTTFLPPAASHRSISSAERVLLQHGT